MSTTPPTSTPEASSATPRVGDAGRASLLDVVVRAEREALDDLASALGQGTSCRPLPGTSASAKALEGRAAALADVRRALVRAADPTPLHTVRQRWRVQAAFGRGPSWQAYLQGGLAALEELG